MKIGPSTAGIQTEAAATPTPSTRIADSTAARQPDAATIGPAEGSAKLELSSTATTMLAGTAASSADFDAAKVDRISRAIADGSFKVNPEAIADRLISNAEELLRGSRPGPAAG